MQIEHQCNGCGSTYPVLVDINELETRPCPCPRCKKRFELRMEGGMVEIVDPLAVTADPPTPAPAPKKKRKRRSFKKKVESK